MKRRWIIAWVLTTLAGVLLHFLYIWLPNPLTALIAPVNESVWEHLKLLFWPYLAAAWLLVRWEADPWQAWTGHLLALLVMPLGLLGSYYALKAGFGVERSWLNIALYALWLGIGFALARHVGASRRAAQYAPALLLAVCLWAVLLTLFTFSAPALPVFLPGISS